MANNNEPKLNIEISDEVAGGTYSNLAIISHSSAEFIVDFLQMMPGVPKAKVKSRIILPPQHAKRLMKALIENIQKYEAKFGPIADQEGKEQFTIPFNGPTGQA
ncbi:MAG: DUF3467 domain-containing protein [Bacteroidales bacterium]|nr:DUF3467 domain-containing protein [Bacteroidales bacterium]